MGVVIHTDHPHELRGGPFEVDPHLADGIRPYAVDKTDAVDLDGVALGGAACPRDGPALFDLVDIEAVEPMAPAGASLPRSAATSWARPWAAARQTNQAIAVRRAERAKMDRMSILRSSEGGQSGRRVGVNFRTPIPPGEGWGEGGQRGTVPRERLPWKTLTVLRCNGKVHFQPLGPHLSP